MNTSSESSIKETLSVVVIGASGDLAKKKTYPSLLSLFSSSLLPEETRIWGLARSDLTDDALRARLKPYLLKSKTHDENVVDEFLSKCFYHRGKTYGDVDAYNKLAEKITEYEDCQSDFKHNRLFYFAIPPTVFADAGMAVKTTAMSSRGWSRVIVEKPFGNDLESCKKLLKTLGEYFREDQLYRIDHYLGKEMVQNLMVLRFGNIFFEKMWNRDSVQCVFCTFKEDIGTEGRGGYFDQFGIIRDIIQNHLMQVLTMLAIEAPIQIDGPEAGNDIRDAKVSVLRQIPPITIDECFLGQYEGYADDETITNKGTTTPTFALIRLFIDSPRWSGVPFILKAGKALDERKSEMRIQFKDAPGAEFMFNTSCPRNELVLRLQPNEAIYMKTNVKEPGFSSKPIQSELEVNYENRYYEEKLKEDKKSHPDAYTRLILDAIKGYQAPFVRDDELIRSWEIFTPILHQLERENVMPLKYSMGSRGPEGADDWVKEKSGYVHNDNYKYIE